jgi:hypothetical protein
MKYATAAAFRQALDHRLKTEAESTGVAISRLRKRVAFELFLRRLLTLAPDRWVLKGALALDFRLPMGTRPTKDIDLDRRRAAGAPAADGRSDGGGDDDDRDRDEQESAIEDIVAAQQLDLDDHFTFTAIRTDDQDEDDDIATMRFQIRSELAGRTFEQFALDVGFAHALVETPDTVRTSSILSFADIDPIDIPAIPLAQHIAEKVHAYTRLYGANEHRSSRPKDLVDIILIATSESLDAQALRAALETTFAVRNRQPLPRQLPPPPPEWDQPYRRLATEVGVEPDLSAAFSQAAAFLDPVLADTSADHWDPRGGAWVASARDGARG